MKNFIKIISLAKNYKSSLFLNIIFNTISVVFGVFSFMMFLPFLEVLFSENGFQQILDSKSREEAGASAPAHGLYLTKVVYPEAVFLTNNQ